MANAPNLHAQIADIYAAHRASGYLTRVPPKQAVTRFPRPAKRRRRPWSAFQQATAAVVALAACLALGVLGTDEYLARRAAVDAAAAAKSGNRHLGSIVFYPNFGLTCRQLFFNNQDGQFIDNGHQDCARALSSAGEDPKTLSAARTEVIREGFRK